jgi:hypothetical protein
MGSNIRIVTNGLKRNMDLDVLFLVHDRDDSLYNFQEVAVSISTQS